jgi:transcriptional regulator
MAEERYSVLRGTLELLILRTLEAAGELHGFEILDWITLKTGGAVFIEDGALYPALHRLEERGWLKARWAVSSRGRRAKYYRLTPEGEKSLRAEKRRWLGYVEAMAEVLNS